MKSSSTTFAIWVLSALFLLLAGGATIALVRHEGGVPLPQPEVIQTLSMPLSEPSSPAGQLTVIPVWFVILLTGFTMLQIFPLIFAAARSRRSPITQRDYRTVTFLCETPVYLGLLGSLIGVAITQFISGSLAAPLAYLTTIAGILLHLFAKFTIWLPMFEERPQRASKRSRSPEEQS